MTAAQWDAKYGDRYYGETEVIAIQGDAARYHVDCARAKYGEAAIDRMLTPDGEVADGAPSDFDHGASTAADWPTDREGNYLTAITHVDWEYEMGPEDNYCDACLWPMIATPDRED